MFEIGVTNGELNVIFWFNIIKKSPILKANREYKQEKVLKREDIKQENIIEGKKTEFKELF